MARYKKFSIGEFSRLPSNERSRYIALLLKRYTKKRPELLKKLDLLNIDNSAYSRTPHEVSQFFSVLQNDLKRGFYKPSEVTKRIFNEIVTTSLTSNTKLISIITDERVAMWVSGVRSKGNEDDEVVLEWAQLTFTPKMWRRFFKSKYFQQVYIGYQNISEGGDLVDYIENTSELHLTPWCDRLIDWAHRYLPKEQRFETWFASQIAPYATITSGKKKKR